MLILALDTCDARGSIALLHGLQVLGEVSHLANEEYSSWLLPAIDKLLQDNRVSHSDLAGYAVASGPGSFTGVRVGLTTAKAWSEVYTKPIFPVSRLAVLADCAPAAAGYAAVFIDALRSQLFAALYRRAGADWKQISEESVIAPLEFFESVAETTGKAHTAFVSLDPQILTTSPFWQSRKGGHGELVTVNPPLAAKIGMRASRDANPQGVDALILDANYVRRSDAEIFGKKAAGS
ncbi:MAG TPA: tRNA (adenosine(37)-N6)-threonylcarbamoyltransferase complex dimerization subunit type 1 TsaB [Candidatus Dormibacteraeota bacterium]|nr:tRNA (adenosine(37)-N6)-threonylcarbamoyltransferase complex dimerization subunit type 1 TsaB [Candidatus Dormibacteraeota bacterium]